MNVLIIGNIHVNNDFLLRDIQGIAGLSGAGEYEDGLKIINLSQYPQGVLIQHEVDQMVGALIREGFTVQYK